MIPLSRAQRERYAARLEAFAAKRFVGGRKTDLDEALDAGAAALRSDPGDGWQPVATIDCRCGCNDCEARTSDIYRMVGACYNCQSKPFLMLFRAGDKTKSADCPVCKCYSTVHVLRKAEDHETPLPSPPSVTGSEEK